MADFANMRKIPIGKPIDDTTVWVLDAQMELVPLGVRGELHFGTTLAAGYLHRPELTEKKFVKNPFGEGMLYKTGDQVLLHVYSQCPLKNGISFVQVYWQDGQLQFVGRIDRQVKIHGFRIELDEIESVLREFFGVKTCAVVVTTVEPKRLCAYICGQGLDRAEVSAHCKGKLPPYMVPFTIVLLEHMPLLATGKRNLAALQARAMEDCEQQETENQELRANDDVFDAEKLAEMGVDSLGMVCRQACNLAPCDGLR
jgi:acyl-CoA synthetase (AMP-forming)/AMP-acid ligase II